MTCQAIAVVRSYQTLADERLLISPHEHLDPITVIGFSLHWYLTEPIRKAPPMERDLTHGNILRTIAVFALPYMLSYLLQMLYGMADLFFIGQFGGAAGITAVANGAQTLYIVTVTLVGLAMGTTVTVGHAIGARRFDRASAAIGNTITLFMGVSLVLTGVLIALCPQIVTLIGTPTEAVVGTRAYLGVCFAGIPFIAAYNVMSAIFRGMGDSRSPMYFVGLACIVNIVLDYVFMGHLGMGPVGAAWGTVIAQTVSVVAAVASLRFRDSQIRLCLVDFRPRASMLGSILKVGTPVAVQDGCIQVAFMFITVIANGRGVVDAAAVGVVEKLISFMFIVPSSMGATVSALTAQNAGAGKYERARAVLHRAMTISICYGMAITALVQLAAPVLLSIFSGDAAVITAGSQYIRSYIFDAIFAGIHICFSGYFAAYGKSYIGFAHNVVSVALVRVPGAALLSSMFPATLFPMGLASPAGSILSAVICVVAFTVLNRRGAFDRLAA